MKTLLAAVSLALVVAMPARAQEILCDPGFQDCRAKLLSYIAHETVRIDFAFNLLEDQSLVDAIVARHRAGVKVRAIFEPRRFPTNPLHKRMVEALAAAGIPLLQKPAGGIFHWKMVLFSGQQVVEFAATNFTPDYLRPIAPYTNCYVDPLYFTGDLALVRSFQTKFDDLWVDGTNYKAYANVTSRARVHPVWPIAPSLSFVPFQNFLTRSKPLYDAETRQIDVVMYKITEAGHADAIVRARARGVPVRLIVEPGQYRWAGNLWQAYHVDRLYAAGVKIRVRAHPGFLHQKTTLLHGQGIAVFGSSNWTLAANAQQWEHNYFTSKTGFVTWMRDTFDRRWFNRTGHVETTAFVPQPPTAPAYVSPANAATGQPLTVVLAWKPGLWAHRADVYFGTTANPPLYKANLSVSAGSGTIARLTIPGLQPGRTYYWRVVSKTMAPLAKSGATRSFGT